jgi:flagellar biosynthesis protein
MSNPRQRTITDKAKQLKRRVDQLNLPEKSKIRAVAIKYDNKKGKAPKIIASGKGSLAEHILEVAEENKIPLYEDPTLTELLSKLDLDVEIPPELYTMVAEVLAFVYQLDKLAKARKALKR